MIVKKLVAELSQWRSIFWRRKVIDGHLCDYKKIPEILANRRWWYDLVFRVFYVRMFCCQG